MSRGIVLVAQNNKESNYLDQAYALALSIKLQSKDTSVCLITDTDDFKNCYDHTVVLKDDLAKNKEWKIQNRYKVFEHTPYDETIVMDVDMLVLNNIDHWWEMLSKEDLFFVTDVKTYRGEKINDQYYRKTFIENNLPNIYSGVYYFKKNKFVKKFFMLVEDIMKNFDQYNNMLCGTSKQKWVSYDVCTAFACKILDVNISNIPITFTHMKPRIQNWNNHHTRWTTALDVEFTNECRLYLDNFLQKDVFHYTEKNFLTSDIIERLEQCTI